MKRFVTKNGSDINISSYIRKAVLNDDLNYIIINKKEGIKLDFYASKYYGDAGLWWIIAAASGIGWWLQIPAGVQLFIPTNIDEIKNLANRI